MKSATRMALVAAAAYPLGRFRKLRWAMSLAAMAASGRLESPAQMATRGVKQLASSKEFGEITEGVRDQLLGAVAGAATTAAMSRLRSLTDQLNDPSGTLRGHGDKAAKGIAGARSSAEEDDDQDVDDDEVEDRSDDERRPRQRATPSQGAREARRRTRGSADSGGDGPRARRQRSTSKESADGRRAGRSQGAHNRSGARSGGSPVRRKG